MVKGNLPLSELRDAYKSSRNHHSSHPTNFCPCSLPCYLSKRLGTQTQTHTIRIIWEDKKKATTEGETTQDVINTEYVKDSTTIDSAMDNASTIIMNPPDNQQKKKTRRRRFAFFRAVLHMLRQHRRKAPLGSPWPAQQQETDQSPLQITTTSSPQWLVNRGDDIEEEMFPPASPALSSSGSTASLYASAVSLIDLGHISDIDDKEEVEPEEELQQGTCEDDMIDAKAEEFIAQFYRQIQIENRMTSRLNSIERISVDF
ncbi:UNVERIFIED_CONTAM: hypothetical protein Slati_0408200 [Sesamum latifolium]|uniref:Uncharacterized protein n=1 Tax=Sesamum latifolium TaxID=2727402 RepID=A0AAW2XV10_9LAMI